MGTLLSFTRKSHPLRTTHGVEGLIGASAGGGLWVTNPSKPLQILRTGRTTTDTLTHADCGQLCRTRQLVHLAVLISSHPVCQEYVSGEAQEGAAALVADETSLSILTDAPIHTSPDGLADARCGLVGVLSARPPVVL